MQEQDEDCPDPYSLCREASVPGTPVYEHRGPDVYQSIRSLNQVIRTTGLDTTWEIERGAGYFGMKALCPFMEGGGSSSAQTRQTWRRAEHHRA
jgi:hypothetical protein